MTQTTAFNDMMDWLEEEVVNESNILTQKVADYSEELTPVGKTGDLKNGYEVVLAKNLTDEASVTNNVPYAAYVELGTIHNKAHHMMEIGSTKALGDNT